MTSWPEVPNLVASYSEIMEMDFGMFMHLLQQKQKLMDEAVRRRRPRR